MGKTIKKLSIFKFHIIILLAGLILFSSGLIDLLRFLAWWFCFAVLGAIFLPLADLIFGRFKHRGYIFAKTLGLGLAGYIQWLLSSLKILPFRAWSCYIVILLCAALNILIDRKTKTYRKYLSDDRLYRPVLNQEALFMGLLLFWSFLRALRPGLEGLEKFMDFGFVNSILRSKWLPAPDIWLAGEGINYYYLGHYFTAFLTRLTFLDSAVTYNLMMATLFALPFMMAYSIAGFLIELFRQNSIGPVSEKAGTLAGWVSGLAVCVGGNLHRAIFGILFPSLNNEPYYFWQATRYIGYNPDVAGDKTIHEFPLYSYIVSDLHAHVLNMLFVLTVIAVVIALAVDIMNAYRRTGGLRAGGPAAPAPQQSGAQQSSAQQSGAQQSGSLQSGAQPSGAQQSGAQPEKTSQAQSPTEGAEHAPEGAAPEGSEASPVGAPQKSAAAPEVAALKTRAAMPKWIMPGFLPLILLIGLFLGTNFWDYPIYLVFTGVILLYANLKSYDFGLKSLLMALGQAAAVAVCAYIVTLPFHLSFDSMGTQVKLVTQRTPLYQLGVLWGYQIFFAVVLFVVMFLCNKARASAKASKKKAKKKDNAAGSLQGDAASALFIPQNVKKYDNRFKNALFGFIERANPADAIVFVIFICAIGLVIIPELVYVVDIYPTHPRANTMFKVGYQAYILFGLGVGYTMIRMTFEKKTLFRLKNAAVAAGVVLLVASLTYPLNAIQNWYGSLSPDRVAGLDGTKYLLTQEMSYTGADGVEAKLTLEDDYNLIRFINDTVEGSPVVAEAYGASYTLNGRISANTGLPDIVNWYYHEILWRNSDHAMVDERRDDINSVYSSGDPAEVGRILEKYDVRYIVVGQIERLMYPYMDEAMLQGMGDIVFRSNDLYMVEVRQSA